MIRLGHHPVIAVTPIRPCCHDIYPFLSWSYILLYVFVESDFYRSRAHISSVRKYRKLRSIRLVTTDRFIEKYSLNLEQSTGRNMNESGWGSYFSALIFNPNLIFIRKKYVFCLYTCMSWKLEAPSEARPDCPVKPENIKNSSPQHRPAAVY